MTAWCDTALARDFLKTDLSWQDKVNLLLQSKTNTKRIRSTALGVLWNKCLRNFANLLLEEWSRDPNIAGQKYTGLFSSAFAPFTEENLQLIATHMASTNLETVLQ